LARGLADFRDRVAVVTGASSGIGHRLAERLAAAGARVALVARRTERLETLAESIRRAGGEALVLTCDVADREQSLASARRIEESFGGVDLLVNNAGYGHHRRFLDWDLDDMERMMRVNYFGALYWTKALLPGMVERKRGWLVFVSSVGGKLAVPEETAYAGSKFALSGFAEALSYEVEDDGVHVTVVCPGTIRTEFFDEEALRRMPAVARRMMADVEPMVDAILAGLARGKYEVTYPRFVEMGYVVRALAPGIMRRNTRKQTLESLAKEGR
jgi:short-subunit dehydrogenase